jgi:renalase
MIEDFIVIGAGISGLSIARKIKDRSLGSVRVVEKSRGVGGRIATRRTLETSFDHGAQFYKLKNDICDFHQSWKKDNISHEWFTSAKGIHCCSDLGMTALTKHIASGIEVSLTTEIKTIHYENDLWKLISTKDEMALCRSLIISSPLPQTAKLLEELSGQALLNQEFYNEIKDINYTKALIALVTLEGDLEIGTDGYIEFESGVFFSISDQKAKGVSKLPALTITMSPAFSEEEFERPDDYILKKILHAFIANYPTAKIKDSELKKWRYCQPKSHAKSQFLEIAPKLYLIGDAFGGSSILGAIRSASALSNFLTS